MVFAGLAIEITRDCNLYCPHCMRYEPGESMDAYRGSVIPTEYIDALFEQHHVFEEILLTGGEPLLHPEIISYIVDKIIEKKIIVLDFRIITNGTIMNEEVVSALNRLYEYINENFYKETYKEAVYLAISEGWHNNKDTMLEALEFYTERLYGLVDLVNSEEPDEDEEKIKLAYSGRAKTFSAPGVDVIPQASRYKIALDNSGKILCRMELTIHGNFVIASTHSFQDADKPENIICTVHDNLLRGILQWNYNNPLNCEEAGEGICFQHTLLTGDFLGHL